MARGQKSDLMVRLTKGIIKWVKKMEKVNSIGKTGVVTLAIFQIMKLMDLVIKTLFN